MSAPGALLLMIASAWVLIASGLGILDLLPARVYALIMSTAAVGIAMLLIAHMQKVGV
jgi:hypothetical protein